LYLVGYTWKCFLWTRRLRCSSDLLMNMCVHVYKVFLQEPLTYMLTCIKCFMMKVCAHGNQIIIMKVCAHGNHMFHFENMRLRASCFIMKVCAHVHKMFYYERMRPHMHHLVSLPTYVLTYIVCFNCGSMCSRASYVFWLTWKVFTVTWRLAFVRGFHAKTEAQVHHSLFSVVLLWRTSFVLLVCLLITFFGSWLFVINQIH
jgi:hypothetical protein